MGDESALAVFCREEWPRLVGALSLYLGSRELAEDLAQETLYRACRHWRTVRTADSPSAWAHRVAFNLAKSHGRRRAAWRRVEARLPVSSDAEPVVDRADELAVRDAVARLSEMQRAVIVLRYFVDLSVAETAEAVGCPQNTVKTHTRRALESLRTSGVLRDDTLGVEEAR